MADKVMKLTIDSNASVLKDDLEKVKLEIVNVTSAQEVLQSILTSPEPLKNIDKIIPAYQKLGTIIGGIAALKPRSVKQLQEAQVQIQSGIDKELDGAKKISDAHKKKLDEINKEEAAFIKAAKEKEKADMAVLNLGLINAKRRGEDTAVHEALIRKLYEQTEEKITRHLQDNNDKRVLIFKEAIGSVSTAIELNYEQQKASLEAKYKLEAQVIRNATDLTIAAEDEKTAHIQYSDADRQAMEIARFQKLKVLDAQYNEEQTKLEQQHQKDQAGILESFMKQRGENLEVHIDTTSKKIKKGTKKTAQDLDSFFQDLMQKDKSFSTETVNQIIDHSVKSQKAVVDAAEKAATATDKTAAATDKATEATKKYIDIEKTRPKYVAEINEYKSMQAIIKDNMLMQIDAFNEEIAAAGDNAEKRKEIESKKLEYIKQTGGQLITIQKSITATEKKEQDLGLLQWKQYGQQMTEVANSVKGTLTSVGDYFSTAFTAISDVYKAEIAGIDEELTQLKNENAGFTQDYANQTAEIAAIKEQAAVRTRELKRQGVADAEIANDAEIVSLKKREDEEQKTEDSMLAKKQEIAAKERELQAKKAKEQEKQEKIEKLKRKAELVKSIGEGIFNIAQGATKALSYGPILGPILAAVVAAAGAIQIGIMTKQLAKFADGGLLNGKRHSEGGMRIEGTNIEVEGGEYVVNRESTSKNLGLVRYINSQRKELTPTDINGFFSKASQGYEPPFRRMFEAGGQMPAISSPNTIDNDALVDAIKSIKISPKVAVTDILRVQDEMVQVDSWSGN